MYRHSLMDGAERARPCALASVWLNVTFAVARGDDGRTIWSLVTAVLTIVLGILILTSGAETGENRVQVFAIIDIVLLLVGYTAWLRRVAGNGLG